MLLPLFDYLANFFGPFRVFEFISVRAIAATLTALMVDFHRLLQKEHVEPIRIRGIRPICMNKYERMFGTTRIPGKENDVIKHRGDSAKHIVVIRRGVFFKIEACLVLPTTPYPAMPTFIFY